MNDHKNQIIRQLQRRLEGRDTALDEAKRTIAALTKERDQVYAEINYYKRRERVHRKWDLAVALGAVVILVGIFAAMYWARCFPKA